MIRNARISDLEVILEITNDAILSTNAIYEEDPWDKEVVLEWYNSKIQSEFPLFVLEEKSRVIGFATYSTFRSRMGYRYTVEHSVYVHKNHRGRGFGKQLLSYLILDAKRNGFKQMIGVVDATNRASVLFHEKNGFEVVGVFKKVGHKHGTWLDATFLQLKL